MKSLILIFTAILLLSNCAQESNDSSTTGNENGIAVAESITGLWVFDIVEHLRIWEQIHNTELDNSAITGFTYKFTDSKLTLNENGTYDLWLPVTILNGTGTWMVNADGSQLILTNSRNEVNTLDIVGLNDNQLQFLSYLEETGHDHREGYEFKRP